MKFLRFDIRYLPIGCCVRGGLSVRISLLDQRELRGVKIIFCFTMIVENHSGFRDFIEPLPLRQAIVIRVAASREIDPRLAHLLA